MIRIFPFILIQGVRRCQSASASWTDHDDSFFHILMHRRSLHCLMHRRSLHCLGAHTSPDLVAHSMRYTVSTLLHHRKSRSLHRTVAHTFLDLVAHSMRYTVPLIHHRCLSLFPCGGGPHTQSRSRSMNHTIAPNVRPLCLRRLANSQTDVIYHTSGSPRAF